MLDSINSPSNLINMYELLFLVTATTIDQSERSTQNVNTTVANRVHDLVREKYSALLQLSESLTQ